jgi:hypothetical protein
VHRAGHRWRRRGRQHLRVGSEPCLDPEPPAALRERELDPRRAVGALDLEPAILAIAEDLAHHPLDHRREPRVLRRAGVLRRERQPERPGRARLVAGGGRVQGEQRGESAHQLLGGRSSRRIEREAVAHELSPGRRRQAGDLDRVRLEHHAEEPGIRDRAAARDQLVEHDAERPDVDRSRRWGAAPARRRHVGRRAGRGVRGFQGELRQAEVDDPHAAVARDHDVLRLQIRMNEAAPVRLGDRFGHRAAAAQRLAHRQRSGLQARAQRCAVDVLER